MYSIHLGETWQDKNRCDYIEEQLTSFFKSKNLFHLDNDIFHYFIDGETTIMVRFAVSHMKKGVFGIVVTILTKNKSLLEATIKKLQQFSISMKDITNDCYSPHK